MRQREARRQNVVLPEARIEMHDVQQAAQHQPRADQQNAGQTYLRDHQRIAQPALMSAAGRRAAAFVQTLVGVGARGLQRRRQAKENARDNADSKRERKHRRAHVNVMRARKIRGQQRNQRLHAHPAPAPGRALRRRRKSAGSR